MHPTSRGVQYMRLTIIALVISLWATISYAEKPSQEIPIPPPRPPELEEKIFLAINGFCKSSEFGWGAIKTLKQEPLFFGNILVNMGPRPEISQPLWVQMWVVVDQDKGNWSIFARLPDDMMCLVGAGNSFTPYTGPSLDEMTKKN